MKIHFAMIFLGVFFGVLFADSMINEDNIIANIPLKSNQVLLFDNRTQKAVGIIEVTPSGKILKIPLPTNNKNTLLEGQTKKSKSSLPQTTPLKTKNENTQNVEKISKPSDNSKNRLSIKINSGIKRRFLI